MDRKIIHIDMDSFYASVEIRDRPELRDKPVAVGGSPEGRGVIATASYVARRFGVKSAMSSRHAKKLCPDLILIPPDFRKYKAESKRVREILEDYTSLIEPLSLDEAYLDVTRCDRHEGSATRIAHEIRSRIWQTTRLTASAGIAPNKFLAKVASDWNKPNGQFTIRPRDVEAFVKALPVDRIPGVGRVTARKMNLAGLFTCADLQKLDVLELTRRHGSWGARLFELARGIDERRVCPRSVRKSFSVEETFVRDLETRADLLKALQSVHQDFSLRWEKARIEARDIKGIFVKIKFADFRQTTHETTHAGPPSYALFEDLFLRRWTGEARPVRLLGLGVRLKEKEATESLQLPLFDLSNS